MFLPINFGCSKEPSHRDGYFEYVSIPTTHVLVEKKNKTIFNYTLISGGLTFFLNLALPLSSSAKLIVFGPILM